MVMWWESGWWKTGISEAYCFDELLDLISVCLIPFHNVATEDADRFLLYQATAVSFRTWTITISHPHRTQCLMLFLAICKTTL